MTKNANAGACDSGAAQATNPWLEPAPNTKIHIKYQEKVIAAGIDNRSRRCNVGDNGRHDGPSPPRHRRRPYTDFARSIAAAEFTEARYRHRWGGR